MKQEGSAGSKHAGTLLRAGSWFDERDAEENMLLHNRGGQAGCGGGAARTAARYKAAHVHYGRRCQPAMYVDGGKVVIARCCWEIGMEEQAAAALHSCFFAAPLL